MVSRTGPFACVGGHAEFFHRQPQLHAAANDAEAGRLDHADTAVHLARRCRAGW
jgi:hypothetical protein